jgi:hypothetical protein
MKDNTQIAHKKISKVYDFPNRSYSKKKKKNGKKFFFPLSEFFIFLIV